ncbi:mycofactocin precursor MftA [Thermomonospora cellulosilytica]|uniref:Mycofactocin n=1 Tax=Thermomonospora cellulosilytica TaxID=1411118 RepID=A0A7W3N0Q6_9ACTN|nr:mycofactocin precursor MftA [Thermomonospora cellulosilytica]MBA9005317.1 mycofactocin precursor [Thermomonospora cellulosilytica]
MDTTAPENRVHEQADDRAEELAVVESLIEEVSIDGMCGVY